MDISKICRICVKKSETLQCISDLDINEKLQICGNIRISKEEGFPDKICYSCELLLQATYRFQNLCETASEKLKKYILKIPFHTSKENFKKKEQKICTLKDYKSYAIPEYVEVMTEEYFRNGQVSELNENCLEPVERLLKHFDCGNIKIERDKDKKFNSEDDDYNAAHNTSDYSNYDSDKSYKLKRNIKKKTKVKIKREITKSSRKTRINNNIEDLEILRKERKSKTTPPKSKRKIFVAKVIPTTREWKESTLNEQKLFKSNAKSIQCFLCGEKLENTTKLRKHLLYHERNKNKSLYNSLDLDPNEKVLCELCGLALENTRALQVHSLLHAENFPYHCKLCPHRTRQAISLKIHMRKHTGEKPYVCPHCRNAFSTSSNRLKHIRTKHTTGPDRPFQCDLCKRHCSSKVTLENHLDSIHYKVKKHYCEHCNSGFYSRKRMLFHRRKVHNVSAEVKGRIPSYIQKEREMLKNKLTETSPNRSN